MNILFITHYSGIGGANIAMFRLIEELKDKNVNFQIVFPDYGDSVLRAEKLNIPYHIVRCCNWVGTPNSSIKFKLQVLHIRYINHRAKNEIANIINRNNIDIVHTNSSFSYIGALAAKKAKVKHVWHIREFLSFFNLEYIFPEKYVKKLYKESNKILFISKYMETKYKDFFRETDFSIVYDGVPVENSNIPEKNEKDIINILYSGGYSVAKGIEEIKNAILNIEKDKLSHMIFHLIVGKIEEIPEMQDWIIKNKLEENIKCLNYTWDITALRKQMDIFVMCSREEAFGLVTAEAMSEFLPIIGCNMGATPELIIDKQTGLLYQYGNAQDLANKIQFAYLNMNQMREMAKNAYERIKAEFSISKNSEETLKIYLETMKSS